MVNLWNYIDREDVIVMVAEKYQKYAYLRWIVKILGFVFIDRFKPDLKALREVQRRLDNGGFLVVAPEGTRSRTGSLREGKPGTAYLASKFQTTIVPVGFTGTEDRLLKSTLRRLQKLDIQIKIGKPYRIPPLPKRNRDTFLQEQTDEIMCQIAALLPPSHRGVYAEHPRLSDKLISHMAQPQN